MRKEAISCVKVRRRGKKNQTRFLVPDLSLNFNWWWGMDSNHRSQRQQIYRLLYYTHFLIFCPGNILEF